MTETQIKFATLGVAIKLNPFTSGGDGFTYSQLAIKGRNGEYMCSEKDIANAYRHFNNRLSDANVNALLGEEKDAVHFVVKNEMDENVPITYSEIVEYLASIYRMRVDVRERKELEEKLAKAEAKLSGMKSKEEIKAELMAEIEETKRLINKDKSQFAPVSKGGDFDIDKKTSSPDIRTMQKSHTLTPDVAPDVAPKKRPGRPKKA